MKTIFKLIRLLADGKFHSGEELGIQLGITRAGIWKSIKQLEELSIPLHSVKGKGYQIPDGLELFEKDLILSYLSALTRKNLSKLEIVDSTHSTNQYLLEQIKQNAKSGFAFLAEHQTAGRGRRGRPWISPFGSNIYCSLLWRFNMDPTELAGLSLIIALVITRALKRYGLTDGIGVKWPNDVYWNLQKLGSNLIEMTAETYGSTYVVIGIGLNLNMPSIAGDNIDQNWVDLQQITGLRPARNQLVGYLLDELITTLIQFEKEGAKSYLAAWKQLDVMQNKRVILKTDSQQTEGIVRGIGQSGELLLEGENGMTKSFFIGDVSLRMK